MDIDVAQEQLSPESGDNEAVVVGSKRLASSGMVIHASIVHFLRSALLP